MALDSIEPTLRLDLALSDERINLVQRLNVEFKNQKGVLPIASVADMSLANDALKLLKGAAKNA